MIVVQRFARWPAVGVTRKPHWSASGGVFHIKLSQNCPEEFNFIHCRWKRHNSEFQWAIAKYAFLHIAGNYAFYGIYYSI